MGNEVRRADGNGAASLGRERVRVAAVGDVHFGRDSQGTLRPQLEHLPQHADLLLVAGDLTQHGHREEGRVLARELAGLGFPIVAILGNHDHHQAQEAFIREDLEEAGVIVLEKESTVVAIDGVTVGIAGVKGFGGGFAGACGSEFGEEEMKAFIRYTKHTAQALGALLGGLEADLRIAMTHYAPIKETLAGEKLEIFPFLGSYLLGEAIDHGGVDLAVHGHAHRGVERGVTPGGIPVRNVAQPVIGHAYNVYCFGEAARGTVAAC